MGFQTSHAEPPVGQAQSAVILRVVEGPDRDAAVVVDAPLLVGSSEVCDLCLSDRAVSRRHLSVEPSTFGLLLRDEGSRNGTWAGGLRVEQAEVPPQTEIKIGATRLLVEPAEAPQQDQTTASEETRTSFGAFLGSASCLEPVYRQLERTASTEMTVLLEGESGTGKELLADAIHDHSPRADGPFVVVDCGALSPQLVEAELFGHERGAFTGADTARAGAFERAHGGTIFLDEVGELPVGLQTRLLRVLDRGEVRRVGASDHKYADVRVVAATNRNLDREVEEGRFRLDLFHRLAVALIRVPPLRRRPGDIERLARLFVRNLDGDEAILTDEVLERLRTHAWPGNVRELRNAIERLVLLGTDLGPDTPAGDDPVREAACSGLPFRKARAVALEAFTELYVDDMLARHGGNVSQAAKAAGVARRHFHRLKRKTD